MTLLQVKIFFNPEWELYNNKKSIFNTEKDGYCKSY